MSDQAATTTQEAAPAPAVPRRGGKLFRKYILLFVALVGGTLLANGALEVWFSYQENKEALAQVQHEKALAAAARIEQFIDEITRQIGWTTRAQWSRSVLEQRRFEYLQLLRQAPAVTEVSHLDAQGHEELRVSRLAMDVIGSGTDYSTDPKFTEAKSRKTWFSPVYFRKESEPYITVAIAGTGRDSGVTVAEVNLKFIWDVISRIKVGQAGYAYVVDTRGLLIAHPDIGLVLRKTDFSGLPQVSAALADPAAQTQPALVGTDSAGRQVLTAHAAITPLDWTVFVDMPLTEAFAPLYASMQRSAALIVLGLALAVGAGLLLARRMVVPIQTMQAGAARIGAGDLDHRINIKTGDELEALADQFNRMTAQLEESYAGLERKVEERTAELTESLEQQTATSEILRVIASSPGKLQPVLQAVAENASRLCEADQVTIHRVEQDDLRFVASFGFRKEQVTGDSRFKITRASAAGRAVIEKGNVHVTDIAAERSEYPASPAHRYGDVKTVLAVPLMREGTPIGTIVSLRTEARPFTGKQIELVTSFADQAVIAIENARLLNELRQRTSELTQSLDELRTAQDRLVQTEKLASLGQLTAGIAHEIKNPLNFVNNFSSLSTELIDELDDVLKSASIDDKTREEIDELTHLLKGNLEKVVQHGKRADSIVKNMLLHSREGSGEHREADINAIVEESLNLAYHGARAERAGFNITLKRDLDPAAGVIDIYPQEITRVFLNLISNGFYAATKRKEMSANGFEPTLSASTKNLGNSVEIRIRDNGTGIPPEVKEKIFNPFFTTKPAGEGTGLGLSMSHDIIVKQHGGRIDVATEPGSFTEFIITLPRRGAAQGSTGGRN